MSRNISVEHNGKTYGGQVMRIESTTLGVEDHGILTAYLGCKGDGTGISVGGYGLDSPEFDDSGKFIKRVPTAYGFDHVMQIVKTAGVHKWEDLVGTDILVLFEGEGTRSGFWGSGAVGIAHLSDEKRVFIFKEHADLWRDTFESTKA